MPKDSRLRLCNKSTEYELYCMTKLTNKSFENKFERERKSASPDILIFNIDIYLLLNKYNSSNKINNNQYINL